MVSEFSTPEFIDYLRMVAKDKHESGYSCTAEDYEMSADRLQALENDAKLGRIFADLLLDNLDAMHAKIDKLEPRSLQILVLDKVGDNNKYSYRIRF
tara:strand:+ start:7002 stop:7292 length:291 start_codon:yes stop_codon:yes gene_type:complete